MPEFTRATINHKLAVVIPSYKVKKHILSVISSIGPEVDKIYVIDDHCPEKSGLYVEEHCNDPRVSTLFHNINQGVGGAVITGYQAAIKDDIDIVIKIDGDGQMDPTLIMDFVRPIIDGEADYTKGNRFFNLEKIKVMPKIRLFGNAVLSLITKLSSGYWNLFDPTNGFTAVHTSVIKNLPLNKLSKRYFFETDMLFRLNILRAVVIDIPMDAKYGDEVSNLKISKILKEFTIKHICNFSKRIFYNYYLRDMSLASIELPVGLFFILFGAIFGIYKWSDSLNYGLASTPGTVMLSALPVMLGLQLVLAFLAYDINSVPDKVYHRLRNIHRQRH
ncbi:glycosyltransferase [Atlantibacter sp.]|uniref:glycosyltransferase n=1 Tax=Atlantibacter sp. TaxID=1903473 RepID=UPI0028AC9DB7|nr:glycosyltransferase [Atlantibacter sp.]